MGAAGRAAPGGGRRVAWKPRASLGSGWTAHLSVCPDPRPAPCSRSPPLRRSALALPAACQGHSRRELTWWPPGWAPAPTPQAHRTPGAPGGCVSASRRPCSGPSHSASTDTGTGPAPSSGQQGPAVRPGRLCSPRPACCSRAHLPLPRGRLPEQEVGRLRGQWWRWGTGGGLLTGRVPAPVPAAAAAVAAWRLHQGLLPGHQAGLCGDTPGQCQDFGRLRPLCRN